MSLIARRPNYIAVLAWILFGSLVPSIAPAAPVLIPLPAKCDVREGSFLLRAQTVIRAPKSEWSTAEILVEAIERATGLKLSVSAETTPDTRDGTVTLAFDATRGSLGEEGYTLEITPNGVTITAAKGAGLFYGMQTLRQLLPVKPAPGRTEYELSCISIEDTPRFGWRGFMLDSSRHFVTKATILKLLDALAMAKINVFHWHLTDHNAWRMAITKYPQLVQVTSIKNSSYSQAMGYYSATDVHEIADRAKRLHITIVPEIEMPGHAAQAAAVLPEASCLTPDGKELPIGAAREICLGSDKAMTEIQDILAETMSLFPDSPYIHIGGDEANDGHWKSCPRCRARMASLGLTDSRLLQKWFMDKMNRFVREHGRTSVAWADRLSLGIPEGQIVHCWHPGEVQEAVGKGFRAIQSEQQYTYFDYAQGPGDTSHGRYTLVMAKVYESDPVRGLTAAQAKLVLGTQAQLWTEQVTDDRVMAKAFPRILALVEVGWTPQEKREDADFTRRLEAFLPRLDALGVPYFKAAPQAGTSAP